MTRDAYKTVTGFALLIPASEADATGEANFLPWIHKQYVRTVSLDEIKKTQHGLRGVDALRFDACLYLKSASESGDVSALEKSLDRFQRLTEERSRELKELSAKESAEYAKERNDTLARQGWEIHPDGSATIDSPFGVVSMPPPGTGRVERQPREVTRQNMGEFLVELLCQEVSDAIYSESDIFVESGKQLRRNPPRIVFWYFEGAFRPAIYCPDLISALYIHTFLLAPAGGIGFRACPYDGEHFFQNRPNQEYCCPAHREAHRVARFRANRKRAAAEPTRKERKRGTQKAR